MRFCCATLERCNFADTWPNPKNPGTRPIYRPSATQWYHRQDTPASLHPPRDRTGDRTRDRTCARTYKFREDFNIFLVYQRVQQPTECARNGRRTSLLTNPLFQIFPTGSHFREMEGDRTIVLLSCIFEYARLGVPRSIRNPPNGQDLHCKYRNVTRQDKTNRRGHGGDPNRSSTGPLTGHPQNLSCQIVLSNIQCPVARKRSRRPIFFKR